MAYKGCISSLAANIAQDCEKPIVGGYTGRAVIIPVADWERAEVVYNAGNPRKVESVVLPPDGSVQVFTIDNVFSVPFTGSTTTGNNESGRNQYVKTLAVRIPMRGADTAKDVVEPLIKNADGYVAIVEKKDRVGDGGFEIIGLQNAIKGDIASVTRDEYANGADWLMNLVTTETWAEADLVGAGGTYESAKKEFEGLLYFEPSETRLVFVEGENSVKLSANGLVVIESVQGGEVVRETYSALNDTNVTINADAGTEVVIYGTVTKFHSFTTYPHNTIASLNVSKNTSLTELNCGGCTGLTSLDLSKNTSLTYLYCSDCTVLTSLDISKNTALTYLDCSSCTGLTSLDVSKNTALTYLNCCDCTVLTSLDVSKNTALTYLNCYGCTGLTSLNVSKNTALTELNCYGCTGLTSLELSKNTALTYLDCSDCTGLTSLDVSKNTALTYLDCSGCTGLMLLDIQNTQALEGGEILDQSMANLTTLQVAGTSAWVYEKVESWLSDYAPNDGKLYVDENTPQGVITEAEAKNWEVIYQA